MLRLGMGATKTADEIIEVLGLEPLPGEGGWFRETYKSDGVIPGSALPGHGGGRSYSTQIYYLLRSGSASVLHRVRSDEVFHHYMGGAVAQLWVDPDRAVSVRRIGGDLGAGERPQVVVPAGYWQGAVLASDLSDARDPDAFALMGCTVAPGFEWEDFELIDRARDEHRGVIDAAVEAHAWAERLA